MIDHLKRVFRTAFTPMPVVDIGETSKAEFSFTEHFKECRKIYTARMGIMLYLFGIGCVAMLVVVVVSAL